MQQKLSPALTGWIVLGVVVALLAIAPFFQNLIHEPVVNNAPMINQAATNSGINTECTTDADCGTGGCNSEVCTTAARAPGIVSACVLLPEHACLQLTSCGCVQGQCAWAQTEQYSACINEAAQRRISPSVQPEE